MGSNIFTNPDKTIKDALILLRKSNTKTLIILDKKEKFLGTLTDGDIRRELLKKTSLNKKIENFYNKNSTYFFQKDYSIARLKQIFLKQQVLAIPIIDINRKVVNVISWNEVFSDHKKKYKITYNIPVMIMAGGLGTRLQPFTNILPKPLIPLNGRAVIEQILDYFKESGINKFYMSLNYKATIMKAFFKEHGKKKI